MANVNDTAVSSPALARLPLELVEGIIWRISIQDARHFYRAARGSQRHLQLAKHISSRFSVARYIDENLGNSSIILKAMSLNLVYMSGSGALEFFKPGIRGPQSDWDFYAPHDLALVSGFMRDMEKVGVTWISPLDQIKNLMMSGSGGHVHLQGKALMAAAFDDALIQVVQGQGFEFVEDWENGDPDYYNVEIDTAAKTVTLRDGGHHDYDDILSIARVIRGELRRGTSTSEIQLIVEERDHPFDTASIFRFHSSAVQCFISGHVACHYYGKSALKGLMHVWSHHIRTSKNQAALQKYRDRGFREKPLKPSKIRHDRDHFRLGDGDQAVILKAYNFTGREQWIVRALEEHVRTTLWREKPSRTTLLPQTDPFGPHCYLREPWSVRGLSDARLVGHAEGLEPHPLAVKWDVRGSSSGE